MEAHLSLRVRGSYLQMLDSSLLLCQLVFQGLNIRSHWLLLRIQGFDHLHTKGYSFKELRTSFFLIFKKVEVFKNV